MISEISFIGVGAVKSGSSWMASLLQQHPEVCMSSRKEIAFFNACNFDGTKNVSSSYGQEYYLKFWPKTEKVKGEVSPQYLFDVESPRRIKEAFPNVHILIMLRDPKQVVYSHYLYEQSFNRSIDSSLPFLEALRKYPYLLKSACFSEQLERYFSIFDKDKIHIYFLDEVLKTQHEFSKQLYTDINLRDVNFKPDYASVNESKQVNFNIINSLIRMPSLAKQKIERSFLSVMLEKVKRSKLFIRIVKWRNNMLDKNVKRLNKPKMTLEEKSYLDAYFRNEIKNLERLLDVDLSRWQAVD